MHVLGIFYVRKYLYKVYLFYIVSLLYDLFSLIVFRAICMLVSVGKFYFGKILVPSSSSRVRF